MVSKSMKNTPISNRYLFIFIFAFIISATYQNILVEKNDHSSFEFQIDFPIPELSNGKISLSNTTNLGKSGYPNLPVQIIILALPSNDMPTLTYIITKDELMENIYIAPADSIYPSAYNELGYEISTIENDSVYSRDKFYPSRFAEVKSITNFRGYNLAEIVIYPVLYNPMSKKVRVIKSARVNIEFQTTDNTIDIQTVQELPKVFNNSIINYDISKNWQFKPKARKSTSVWSQGENWLRITTGEQGIYKINGSDLEGAGIRLSDIDVSTLSLFSLTSDTLPTSTLENDTIPFSSIPYLKNGLDDNSFDRNDYILFFNSGYRGWRMNAEFSPYFFIHPFTTTWTVWLTYGGDTSPNILPTKNSTITPNNRLRTGTSLKHFESDIIWNSGTYWIWDEFNAPSIRQFYFLDPMIAEGESAIIEVGGNVSSISIDGVYATQLETYTRFLTTNLRNNSSINMSFSTGSRLDWYRINYKRQLNLSGSEDFVFLSPDLEGGVEYIFENTD